MPVKSDPYVVLRKWDAVECAHFYPAPIINFFLLSGILVLSGDEFGRLNFN